MSDPFVSLIVVTYNGREHLGPCLESVFALDYPADRLEVLVVDNGSSDGSAEFVRERFPQVRWLSNNTNNYCRANNLAVSHAKGFVIGFLNNDVQLDRRWLRELLSVLFMEERIGAVGGKVLLEDGVLNSTGQVELPHGVWTDRGLREPDVGQFDAGGPVDGLSGTAVLYQRRCLDDIGPFDEDFHMYYEDIDLTYRCRQQGWKLMYVPSALAHHAFHGTASEAVVAQQTTRNRLLLLAKHWPERLAPALSVTELSDPSGRCGAVEVLQSLPAITNTLIKHHGVDGLARWLPGIAEEVGKLIRRERQFLSNRLSQEKEVVQQLCEEVKQVRHLERERLWSKVREVEERFWTSIRELEQQLRHEQQVAAEKAHHLVQLEQSKAEKDRALGHLEHVLAEKDHVLGEKDRALNTLEQAHSNIQQALQARTAELEQQRRDHSQTRQELDNLYHSAAHRFLVRPLWAVLVVLRRPIWALFHWERRRILIVKTFYVTADDALCAVAQLRNMWPQARLTFLANVFPKERKVLEALTDVEGLWLFDPWFRRLTWWRLIALIVRAHMKGFAEGVLLVGPRILGRYRKGTLLLSAVTPSVQYYHVETTELRSDNLAHVPQPLIMLLRRAARSSVKGLLGGVRAGWTFAHQGVWSGWSAIQRAVHTLPWWRLRVGLRVGWLRLVFGVLALGFITLVWWPMRWRRRWWRR